ncbi:MAG: glutamate--tRNA ligase, partial [Finegoldia magna]|nr:glutamate--tRNA ligase [Finegoldia magna]
EKLNWINRHYIKEIENEKLASMLKPYLVEDGVISEDYPDYKLLEIASLFKEELDYLQEIAEKVEFLFKDYEMDDDAKEFLNYEKLDELMNALKEEVESVDEIEKEFASGVMKRVQKKTGIKGKDLWMTTRAVITGNVHGPDLDSIMVVLGKQEVLDRINKALNR